MKKIRSASLKIGKVLNDELKDIINIYPIIAPQNAFYPFAVYKRNNLSVENTKDVYNTNETANVEIVIATQGYLEGVDIAINVKMYLEHLKGSYKTKMNEQINISDITLIDASEDYNNEAYLQIMTFQITMDNEVE